MVVPERRAQPDAPTADLELFFPLLVSVELCAWQGRWLRLCVGVRQFAPLDALVLLEAQDSEPLFAWVQRESGARTLGWGSVWNSFGSQPCEVLTSTEDVLHGAPSGVRAFGGVAFDATDSRDAPEWSAFHKASFWIPRLEWGESLVGTNTLSLNIYAETVAERDSRLAETCAWLRAQIVRLTKAVREVANACQHGLVPGQDCFPDQQRWISGVNAALNCMGQGIFAKVVMARVNRLRGVGHVSPLAVWTQLSGKSSQTYTFLLRPQAGSSFLGASPELLYRRQGNEIFAEALAGTVARDAVGDAPKQVEEALCDAKLADEHQWVAQAVRGALQRHCLGRVSEAMPEVVSLPHLHHRRVGFSGLLHNPLVNHAAILGSLHPTPAVGGTPRQESLAFIRQTEPFVRGWYAGAVGWLAADSCGEFSVAIRSSLLSGEEWYVYAGAGIVPQSDPRAEWREIDLKMRSMLDAICPTVNSNQPINHNVRWSLWLAAELRQKGVSHVVICPGARSAPLAIAFARGDFVMTKIIHDERAAGFWALGCARTTGKRVVVVCTSGTAVANLLPAVVEAACDDVPLLIISADRPACLRGTGANQTIDQAGLFGSFAPLMWDRLPPSSQDEWADFTNAWARMWANLPWSPVQVNCQFADPLWLEGGANG